MSSLMESYNLAGLRLNNRIVMGPMTRARAFDSVPTELMATYYGQRASAGLIITESIQVSEQGRGYLYTPGLHTAEQVEGWKRVTQAVHDNGGRIFAQLWHVGRVSHVSLQPGGKSPISSVARPALQTSVHAYGADGLPGQIQASEPVEIDLHGVIQIIEDFRRAARNAMDAGFDGVEIHAGNGFLFEQFINGGLNTRTDKYGGSCITNRLRLLLETVDTVAAEIGGRHIGVRISPFARLADLHAFEGEEATWLALAGALSQRSLAYLHASHLGTQKFQRVLRNTYAGTLMLAGGYTGELAAVALDQAETDLVVFGRPFISNPDFVARLQHNWPLSEAGEVAFYGGGAAGYTDYPFHPPNSQRAEVNTLELL